MHTVDTQLEIIKRGAVDIVCEEELRKKIEASLRDKRPLNIKAGFDPTAPDLHLGHTVLLRKLRAFQDLGHRVYFLIGDFTGRIGDPTGRSELRKQLSPDEVTENAATYTKQVSKILDMDRTEVVFNSSWFDKMSVLELLKLTMHATVAQMLARADFKNRMTQQQDISILEFIYPLLQGYDSVELKADVELGGTDQIFNLLFGRQIQKDFHQDPQVVITMPLLEGTDGIQKMSKSYGNYVGIGESAKAIFGKIMSISDEMMLKYFTLLTDISLTDIATMHPKDAKVQLAWNIVAQYYGAADADAARQEFERVFSQKEIPEDIAVYALHAPTPIIDLLVNAKLVASKNEARRLIEQGGVSLDGTPISQEDSLISTPGILKVGKRRFLKLKV